MLLVEDGEVDEEAAIEAEEVAEELMPLLDIPEVMLEAPVKVTNVSQCSVASDCQ